MRLSSHLSAKMLRVSDFAVALGIQWSHAQRYLLGERIPRRETMARIYWWTEGNVTPNDFYDLPLPQYLPHIDVDAWIAADADERAVMLADVDALLNPPEPAPELLERMEAA